MANPLRIVVGRECRNEDCTLRGRRVRVHLTLCEGCSRPLHALAGWNDRLIIALVVGTGLAFGLGLLGLSALQSSLTARRDARLLAAAEARLVELLPADGAPDPEALAQQVQAEFSLSPAQRERLLVAVAPRLARLPRPLTPELASQFTRMLREALRDGSLSVEEEAERIEFLHQARLESSTAERFEADLRTRLERARACISRSQLRITENRFEEARRELVEATAADPDDPIAWANLGAATALLGREEEARACYEKAIALDSACWLAHYNLGLLAARAGDADRAFHHVAASLSALSPEHGTERSKIVAELLEDSTLTALRAHVRFHELLASSKLAPS